MTRPGGSRRKRIAFGPFSLDQTEGRLWRGEEAVPLRPKTWEVLCHLVTRPRTLVSTDELLDAVWRGLAVTPQTLTNVIRELRVALADSPRQPRFIETVHGRGYVFHDQPPARRSGDVDRAPTPAQAPAANAELLVGRGGEFAQLQAAWAEACQGQSRIVFLSGEPGIGKTALAAAFARTVADAAAVAHGTCIERHGEGEAYLPLLEGIDRLAGGPDGRRVRARLRRYAPTWLLQLPWRLDAAERRQLERSLHQTTAARMLREGIALLDALAADAPLLALLEDLHWSDLATLDLIAAVARRAIARPVLIIATYRPVDATRQSHPMLALARDLTHAGHASEVALTPLDAAAVRDYLDARFGPAAADADLVQGLEQHSAGNPLFLRSLVDQLVAGDALARVGGVWRLARATSEILLELPPSLRAFVLRALDELPAAQRAVVEVASVAGLEFAADAIAAATGAPALDVEAVCDALAHLGRLFRYTDEIHPRGSLAPPYAFVHAAYRRVVYEQIAPLRRRELHREVALALEPGTVGGDVPAAQLATHFAGAGVADKAATYYDLAAVAAMQRFAYRESINYLRAALEQLDHDRRGGTAEAAALHWRLGTTVPLVDGYASPESAAAFERAEAIFTTVGAVPGMFLSIAGLCRHALACGEIGTAHGYAERLTALADGGPPGLQALGCLWAGFTASALGELDRARALLEQGAAAPGDAAITGEHDNHRVIASQLALILAACDAPREAEQQAAVALQRARASGRPADLAHAWLLETERCAVLGDAAAGVTATANLTALAAENAFVSFLAFARFYAALFDEARPGDERVAAMRAAMEERRHLGDRWHGSMLLALIAGVQVGAGDVAGARDSIDRGEAHVHRTSERHFQAELQRLRGECAARAGQRDEAAAWFGTAMRTAQDQGARLFARRAAASLARLS